MGCLDGAGRNARKNSHCSTENERGLIYNGRGNKSKSGRTEVKRRSARPSRPAAKRDRLEVLLPHYLRIEKGPKCKIKIRRTTRKQHANKARTNLQETTQRTHRPSQAQSTSHTTTEPVRHKLRQLVPRQQKTKPSTKPAHTNTQQDTTKTKHQQRGGQNNFLESNPF